jgi:hypothetical protein
MHWWACLQPLALPLGVMLVVPCLLHWLVEKIGLPLELAFELAGLASRSVRCRVGGRPVISGGLAVRCSAR